MKTLTKKLLVAVRRSVLLGLSTALAASAAVAEPLGIHYSDFITYGADAYAPFVFDRDITSLPVFPDAALPVAGGAGGLFGLGSGLTGLVAAGIVVGGVIGLSKVAGAEDAARTTVVADAEDAVRTTVPFSLTERACTNDENGAIFQRFGFDTDYIDTLPTSYEASTPGGNTGGTTIPAETTHLGRIRSAGTDAGGPADGNLLLGLKDIFLVEQSEGSFEIVGGTSSSGSERFRVITLLNRIQTGNGRRTPVTSPVTLGLLTNTDTRSGSNPPPSSGVDYALFRQNDADANGKVYLARRVMSGGSPLSCSAGAAIMLTAEQFALAGGVVPSGETVFSLQYGWRGYMGDDVAVRLGDFFFRGDAKLQNLQLEQRLTPWASEGFALHTDSGYKRWGDSRVIYSKMTAKQTLSPQLDIYVQAAAGDLQSVSYRNSAMNGFALGVFYERLLSHDDSYHVRLEKRFAAVNAEEWRWAADTSIGTVSDYLRLGLHHQVGGNKAGMRLFYSREF